MKKPTRKPCTPLEYAIFRAQFALSQLMALHYDLDSKPEPEYTKEFEIENLTRCIEHDMRIIRREVMHK
jgi:hypothetical protein